MVVNNVGTVPLLITLLGTCMKRRLLNILVSLDQFALSLLTLGWAYPTGKELAVLINYQGVW